MKRSLDHIIADAVAAHLLPSAAYAIAGHEAHRRWSIVLLKAFGAWLAAFPLLGILYPLLDDLLKQSTVALYLAALMLCGGAVSMLRRSSLPLSAGQLAIPALLAGATAMSIGLYTDMSTGIASTWVALLAIAIAAMIPRHWLRVLLGAFACAFIMVAVALQTTYRNRDGFWVAVHGALFIWLVVDYIGRHKLRSLLLDRLPTGWVLTILAGLALWTGMTFMAGALLDSGPGQTLRSLTQPLATIAQCVSAAMALAGAVWLARGPPCARVGMRWRVRCSPDCPL